jgi:nucleolar GTP-binding protein
MSFQTIPKIETPDTYLDIAFRQGRQRGTALRLRTPNKKPSTGAKKNSELAVFKSVNDYLSKTFDTILNSFPQVDKMTDFYRELLICTLDVDELKRCLGALAWAKRNVERFWFNYSKKIHHSHDEELIVTQRKALYGRLASIVKQIAKELLFLEAARKKIKEFPVIKEGMKTVCIFGFPNVGKTTLLAKLTLSRPEIAAYPFTTKSINLGYIDAGMKRKIQLLDTPGTLNRFEKMNDIEKQAYLALKYVADTIVYVFDLTGESYPIDYQLQLYESLKEFNKPILIYYSKSDLLAKREDRQEIDEFLKNHPGYSDAKELEAVIAKA